MNDLIASLLLGLIEGITEFLPISSTGHLLIAEHWLGARSDLFNIAIQAGAILAVVFIYRERLLQLAFGFAERANRDAALKLGLAFGVTAVLGLTVKKLGVQLPETLGPIAWALLVGGVMMLWAERAASRRAERLAECIAATRDGATAEAAIGWGAAALVGVAQVVAGVFPGTSRSAAAIFAALLFGAVGRAAATEFAFLVGIPTMFAATAYELLHVLRDGGAAGEDWTGLGVAFVVSALTAFAAVKWLLGYIVTHRFTVFSWYRIVLGVVLLGWIFVAPAAAGAGAAASARAGAAAASDASADARAAGAATVSLASGTNAPTMDSAPARSRAGPAVTTAMLDSERQAADRAFTALERCITARRMRASLADPVQRADLEAGTRQMDAETRQPHKATEPMVRDILNRLGDDLATLDDPACAGRDAQTEDGSIYALALRAARLGNRHAANCYVSTHWAMPAEQWTDPATFAAYQPNALALLQQGVQAGDWTAVVLSTFFANPRGDGIPHGRVVSATPDPDFQWVRDLPATSPMRAYSLYRLLQLGALGHRHATDYQRIAANVASQLTGAQVAEGDAWARTVFSSRFSGRKDLPDFPIIC